MGKRIAAGIVGVVVAFITVWLIQKVGHMAFPPPAGLDVADAEAFAAYVDSLPLAALLIVIASYFIGTLDGTFLAAFIAPDKRNVYALLIGGLMLLATIVNLATIRHPTWFSITAIVSILFGAWLGQALVGMTSRRGN